MELYTSALKQNDTFRLENNLADKVKESEASN